jgi:hypothetical protein
MIYPFNLSPVAMSGFWGFGVVSGRSRF